MWSDWFRRRHRPSPVAVTGLPVADCPPGTLRLLSPQELLRPRGERINRIEELAATTPLHFRRYYLSALQRFARWVQQLPASESHHHAHAGGLLDHALEVAVTALQIRLGYLLPLGGVPEEIARDRDRWTYALFCAALVHDAGKPAVDQKVRLFDAAGTEIGLWNPWIGDMPEVRGATHYRTEFVRQRQYRLHEKAALLIAPRILPAEGLAWLAEDRDGFALWLAYACGDTAHSGVIGEILGRADGHSVARNLGAETVSRAATTQVVPLWEKLVTALRHLIESKELPLNRNGAAGWRVGDDLWLVSKRTVDALRLHLTQTGHPGIPTQNERLFDVLQEHDILTPFGDRAIWRAEVRGKGFAHTLTLLRIPAARLWAEPERWPEAFAGDILVPEAVTDPLSGSPAPDSSSPVSDSPAIPVEVETDNGGAADAPDPNPKQTIGTSSLQAAASDPFLNWLIEGLAEKRIPYNHAGARVHVVAEGVLLLSPAIFMDYVAAAAPGETWEKVQKRFLKRRLHVRTAKDFNIHRYRTAGEHRQGTVTGLLLKDPKMLFPEKVPKPNPYLVTTEELAEAAA